MSNELVKKYLREDMLPHIWCPGCGHGILMKDIISAVDKLGLDPKKVCIVSGIGCSSRAAGYMNFNTIHTTHGRAIAVATGIKMANPELTVIVITGDGDATAIGGNHFIHAARRNIDINVMIFNNNIYGMTGGQYSPTTPMGEFGTTAPYGNIDQSFDIPKLAIGAGATFVARATAFHVDKAVLLMQNAISHKGFSVVECVSVCPTYYGRKNKKGSAVDMLKWQKEHAVDSAAIKTKTSEELKGKLVIGEIYCEEREEYVEKYQRIIDRLRGEGK